MSQPLVNGRPTKVQMQMSSQTYSWTALLPVRIAAKVNTDVAAAVFLAAICLAFFGRFLGLYPWNAADISSGDLLNQFYPFHSYYASEIAAGRLPLWNPYILAGHPFLADPQVSALYPLNFVTAFVLGRSGLALSSLLWQITIDYVLGAIFTYFFAKQIVGSRFGALVGSTMFTLGGFLTSYPMQQMPILETAIWLPLVLYLIERGIRNRTTATPSFALAGVALALSYLAGHPQTAMFITYASVLYLILRATLEGVGFGRLALNGAILIAVAVGLSAAQLLPTLEFFFVSTRTHTTFDAVSQGYDLGSLIGILIPGWRDEVALYVGAIAPSLIPLVVLDPRRKRLLPIGIIGLLGLALAMGRYSPLYQLLYSVAPGFALFQHQERAIFIFALAMAVAVGDGCAQLFAPHATSRSKVALSIAGTIVALVVVALAVLVSNVGLREQLGLSSNPPDRVAVSCLMFAGTASAGAVVIILGAAGRFGRYLPRALLLGLVVFDLFAVNWNRNVGYDTFPISPSVAAAARFVQNQNREDVFRVRVGNDEVLPANYPALFGLQHIGGDTPIQLARVQDLLSRASEWKLWQLFNVQYVFSRRVFDQGVEQVYTDGELRVYHVTYGLPRAYAVRQYVVAQDSQEELDMAISPARHPGDTVVLDSPPKLAPTFTVQERPKVTIVKYDPQYVRIETDGVDDSILVVSDAYYPGWRTFVDSKEVRTLRANYAFRGVELPRGQHVVEMVFDPVSFKLGSVISTATALLVLGLALAPAVRRRLPGT